MAIIKCKMCGGDIELSNDKTFGTCDSCGSTMTLPKVDDEQRAAAFNRGNHFRRIGEFDKALAVYERIVNEDERDAEAHWCCALCRFGIEYVEDPATYEFLPTCHRASFDSFLEDVDYLAALEYSDGVTKRQYQKDAAKIAEVQRGILATSQNAEPFDVFICYKESDENGDRTRDSLLAQDIYYQLTDQGRKVFFSMITLENVPGVQYEPYIFAALNSAKVMVVVGTKPEYLNAVWVKNEWSRFLAMMKKDRHKLLLPCYRDMDPYDMPEQLSVLQSYDMGKIGFIQDLTRGIAKVLDADKPKQTPATETVVVQQGGSNVDALLKRGNMALEDGLWVKAEEFFEEVLNQNAECAEAYLGIALLMEKCANLQALVNRRIQLHENVTSVREHILFNNAHVSQKADELALPGFLEKEQIRKLYEGFDCGYSSYVTSRKNQKVEEERFWQSNKNLARAFRFATGDTAKALAEAKAAVMAKMDERIEKAIQSENENKEAAKVRMGAFLKEADEKALQARKDAEEMRHGKYENCKLTLQGSDDPKTLRGAAYTLKKLDGYLDSAQLAHQCIEKADRLQAELDRIAEEKRIADEAAAAARAQAAAAAAAKRKKTGIIIGIIAAVAVIALIATAVALSSARKKAAYAEANALLEQGNYVAAVAAFRALDDIEMVKEARFAQAEATLAQGEWEMAEVIILELGDYPGTQQLLEQVNQMRAAQELEDLYNRAQSALDKKDFDSAREYFEKLDDGEMLKECDYQEAISMLAYGIDADYEKNAKAREMLIELGDYSDAATYASQLQYVCIGIKDSDGETTYLYDAHGRKSGEGVIDGMYEYNEDGLLIRSQGTTYEYNDQGQKIRATSSTSTSTSILEYGYNENGDVAWYRSTMDMHDESLADLVYTVTYEYEYENGRIVKETVNKDGKLDWVNTYLYNADGWLLEEHQEYYAGRDYANDRDYNYTYDENGYLIKHVFSTDTKAQTTEYYNGYIWAPEA